MQIKGKQEKVVLSGNAQLSGLTGNTLLPRAEFCLKPPAEGTTGMFPCQTQTWCNL